MPPTRISPLECGIKELFRENLVFFCRLLLNQEDLGGTRCGPKNAQKSDAGEALGGLARQLCFLELLLSGVEKLNAGAGQGQSNSGIFRPPLKSFIQVLDFFVSPKFGRGERTKPR